jgi:biopolymer transport protein ExbD
VRLPSGKGELKSNEKGRDISIDATGNLFLDGLPVSKEELKQAMSSTPNALVYVRADTTVNYGRVAEVVSILKEAKIEKMALVTQAEE